jgi:hypothetical protein
LIFKFHFKKISLIFLIMKERKIQEVNESLTKNSNELVEQKIQETARLEQEIKQLKETVSNLEREKINSDNAKNSQISDLVKKTLNNLFLV